MNMRRWMALVLVAGLFWSCGKSPNPMESVDDGTIESVRLTKQAVPAATTVRVRLTQNGEPVSGATVALSRSVAGMGTDYRWMGTTDANGQAMIDAGGKGYYLIRATNASGTLLGQWGSVPINGAEQTIWLPIGAPAQVTRGAAQKTTFRVRIENIAPNFPYAESGVFHTPEGTNGPGPLLPGGSYVFSFYAAQGSRVSFATMFVHSNDWFYGSDETGLALWDASGNPISGDVTSQIYLWDAGTEIDQTPGTGADQAPRQSGPNTGAADPNNTVRRVTSTNVPSVSSVVRVTITPGSDGMFTVRIQNVSASASLPTPLAPGVFAVHTDGMPLFTSDQTDRGEGLEALAEDGNPEMLLHALRAETGVVTPLAPGTFAIHSARSAIFQSGRSDRSEGLEALAEDGNPGDLASALAARYGTGRSGAFNTPEGTSGPGPLLPGSAYTFTFSAEPGARLSFATMFVQSNDWFYAPDEDGLALWNTQGNPISGDVTNQIYLWDAGTEMDQVVGLGADQAPRQSGPNTGAADSQNTVRSVHDSSGRTPPVSRMVRVTITPEG